METTVRVPTKLRGGARHLSALSKRTPRIPALQPLSLANSHPYPAWIYSLFLLQVSQWMTSASQKKPLEATPQACSDFKTL